MATLNITYTLTPGTAENVNHVQQNFSDVTTWANGNISDANLVPSTGVYRTAHSLFTHDFFRDVGNGTTAATSSLMTGNAITSGSASSSNLVHAFYIAAADYSITGRTPKMQVRAFALPNGTAPATTITVGLYEVTACGGAGFTQSITFGSPVSGTTVAFVSPAANSQNIGVSTPFSVPSDGYYILGATSTGTVAANSVTALSATLQVYWV